MVALESVIRRSPDIYIDTMGCALPYPAIKLLFAHRVVAYVHYPAISTDMLQRVWLRRPGYNNSSWITSHPLSTHLKHIYYRLFAVLYGWAGRSCDRVLANSSWTRDHLVRLGWGGHIASKNNNNSKSSSSNSESGIGLMYPPCGPADHSPYSSNTSDIDDDDDGWGKDEECRLLFNPPIPITSDNNNKHKKPLVILSVGQFRPEKDHLLQLR